MSRPLRPATPVLVVVVLFVLAIPLGLIAFSGRSGANFADSERFEGNRLGAGSVDISLADPGDGATSIAGTSSSASDPRVFRATNMAPGDSTHGTLTVGNSGTLPARIWITASAAPATSPLIDWLLFDVWTGSDCAANAGAGELAIGNLVLGPDPARIFGNPVQGSGNRRLAPSSEISVCLGARLPLAAPNEVQSESVEIELVVHAEHDLEVSE